MCFLNIAINDFLCIITSIVINICTTTTIRGIGLNVAKGCIIYIVFSHEAATKKNFLQTTDEDYWLI